MSEDLTARRFAMMDSCKAVPGVDAVWSRDGVISVVFNGQRRVVWSEEDIEGLKVVARKEC